MTSITPFKAPRAPEPEPEAVLKFGDIEIRLTLTYLHHLRNCQGWGDRTYPSDGGYGDANRTMDQTMQLIEQEMWKEIDRRKEAK